MVYARHVKRHTGGGEKEVKVFACPDVHHLIGTSLRKIGDPGEIYTRG